MTNEKQPTLTFDGVEHVIADLSDEAKTQLQGLQQAELEMQRLQVQLAMITTARNTYNQALAQALSQSAESAESAAPAKAAKPAKKKKAAASA